MSGAAEEPEDDARARVRALVAECLDRFDAEGPAAIDALCAANPEHAEAIRSRVAKLASIGLLERESGGDERIPERLGDFRLLRKLGGGGMGVVFLAEQSSLGRRVALKVVRPSELYFGHARERFKREAQIVATLRHPGIVPVYAFGTEGDLPYFAMEHVDGASLADVLARLRGRDPAKLSGADFEQALAEAVAESDGASPARPAASASLVQLARLGWLELCLRLARDAADALAHAHAHGVVHRDVKPSNVMLTREGQVRLVDFGLSTRSSATKITRTGSELGSLPYMPPELLSGGMEAVDARGDVYALGVTLIEMVTLQSPFATADREVTRRNILAGRTPPLRTLNRSLPRDVETIALKAIDLEPARRYASAEAFARDLGNVLSLRPIDARPATAWRKLERWARRDRARAAALALALLIVVGAPLGWGFLEHAAAKKESALNLQLGQSLNREGRERDRAEKNAERARRAVKEMLTDVGADELRNVAQMAPIRHRLLEKAVAFYRELLAETPDDPALQFERADATFMIARLERQLGRNGVAETTVRQAIELQRGLVAARPDDAKTVTALADSIGDLAHLESLGGRDDLARGHWKEAADLLESLEQRGLATADSTLDLVTMLSDLAYTAYAKGELDESLRLCEAGLRYARPLHAADPKAIGPASELGHLLDSAGTTLANLSRSDDSLAAYREGFGVLSDALALAPRDTSVRMSFVQISNNYGLRLLTRADAEETGKVLRRGYDEAVALQRDFPDDPDLQKKMAILGANLGAHLFNEHRIDECLPVFDSAVATLEQLVKDYPLIPDYLHYLGSVLANAAGAHLEVGELDRAEAEIERALELSRKALGRSAGHPGYLAAEETALFEKCHLARLRGDLDGALATAKEALAIGVARSDVLYDGAVVLGDCARKADELGDEELLQEFVELALSTLHQAIRVGFTDAARARAEPALELLRAHDEFESTLAEIPARAQ
jgi:serine/threonine protein kinase